jgi:UDP-N-acetylmuramoylalanine--D-glutamate ligase
MERYIEIKESVGRFQTAEDFMILNHDDPNCRKLISKARQVFFSRLKILNEGFFLDGKNLRVRFDGKDYNLLNVDDMNIFGNHNIENALASAAAGICANVAPELVRDSILNFKAVEHRIEFVRELRGVKYYNDSKATNTDAAVKAIEAMPNPIVLIGGGYDKQADFGDWVGAFDGRVKHLFVLGEVTEKIIETCRAYNYSQFTKVNSLKSAVELARDKAKPGDCVLLSPACASWDMFDDYEQRGKLFKQFVNALQ